MYRKFLDNLSAGISVQDLISTNLRLNRLINGLSQEEVAQAVSISRSKYNRIEKGHMCPDVLTLCSLLVLYNISLETLLSMCPGCSYFSEEQINKSDCSRHCCYRNNGA